MAAVDWAEYADLCDHLREQQGSWAAASDLASLSESIQQSCPQLVGGDSESVVGDHGFAALKAALTEDYSDDVTAEWIHLAALSQPAADLVGLGLEGYYVSQNLAGEMVFAASRFAEPADWGPFKTLDTDESRESEDEAGTQAAPQFDAQTNRWRRRDPESGELEYHDSEDDVWERAGEGGLWMRLNAAVGQWLPYDKPSGTWLIDGQWVPLDQGEELEAEEAEEAEAEEAEEADAAVDPALEQAVALSLEQAFEMTPGAEQLSPEEIEAIMAEVIAEVMADQSS